jgi:DedD protein
MTIIRGMDRSLKARLIGASVLVLIVVLVAPELLSGRKAVTGEAPVATTGNGQTRTYTIELGKPGSAATTDADAPRGKFAPEAAPPAAERAPRAAQSPEPATSPAAQAQVASAPPQTRPARTREPPTTGAATAARESGAGSAEAPDAESPRVAKQETGSSDSRPSRGTWSVQVGAFGSSESARKLVEQLEADGFSAYVSSVYHNGKRLHRVRVGPESARAAADALAGRLKSRGLPVSLVAND